MLLRDRPGVGDVHVADPVNRHPVLSSELGGRNGTVPETATAGTGQCGHDRCRIDLTIVLLPVPVPSNATPCGYANWAMVPGALTN